jgi:peptidoglycan/xylan/chitin deacetylase (PgdA/CDA1 family)
MNKGLFKLIRYSGLPFLFRELVQRNKVTILMFHDVDAQRAALAFAYLKKHYHVIGLQDYLKSKQIGGALPKKAVIITFDDGHAGNYQLLPVIRQLQLPITIFLCSDIVGTRRHFWFKHSDEMAQERQQLKKVSNAQRLEVLRKYGFEQEREYDDRHALTHEEIDEMKPWVDFQSHTCFHPCLPQCDDTTARQEIVLSKQHLEHDYSFSINTISYPNGDYSQRDIQIVKEAGYICGITVDYGFNDQQSDLFRLKRISVNDVRQFDEFVVKSSGCYAYLKQLVKRLKK